MVESTCSLIRIVRRRVRAYAFRVRIYVSVRGQVATCLGFTFFQLRMRVLSDQRVNKYVMFHRVSRINAWLRTGRFLYWFGLRVGIVVREGVKRKRRDLIAKFLPNCFVVWVRSSRLRILIRTYQWCLGTSTFLFKHYLLIRVHVILSIFCSHS